MMPLFPEIVRASGNATAIESTHAPNAERPGLMYNTMIQAPQCYDESRVRESYLRNKLPRQLEETVPYRPSSVSYRT